MHEHKFTEQIVQSVLDELHQHPETRPKWVEVTVGEVFHLEEDSVQMHFEMLTRDTPLQGVELRLTEEPLEVTCRDCGETGPVEDHHLPNCNSCGSLAVKPVRGNHVDVRLMEVP
jgi:hydrogenase nickel incorporation protein HypA/HybF